MSLVHQGAGPILGNLIAETKRITNVLLEEVQSKDLLENYNILELPCNINNGFIEENWKGFWELTESFENKEFFGFFENDFKGGDLLTSSSIAVAVAKVDGQYIHCGQIEDKRDSILKGIRIKTSSFPEMLNELRRNHKLNLTIANYPGPFPQEFETGTDFIRYCFKLYRFKLFSNQNWTVLTGDLPYIQALIIEKLKRYPEKGINCDALISWVRRKVEDFSLEPGKFTSHEPIFKIIQLMAYGSMKFIETFDKRIENNLNPTVFNSFEEATFYGKVKLVNQGLWQFLHQDNGVPWAPLGLIQGTVLTGKENKWNGHEWCSCFKLMLDEYKPNSKSSQKEVFIPKEVLVPGIVHNENMWFSQEEITDIYQGLKYFISNFMDDYSYNQMKLLLKYGLDIANLQEIPDIVESENEIEENFKPVDVEEENSPPENREKQSQTSKSDVKCVYCDKCYSSRAHMLRHVRRIHRINDEEESDFVFRKRKLDFTCPLCRKVFHDNWSLQRHFSALPGHRNANVVPVD